MLIRLLGSSGCSNCQKLEALVREATDELGIAAEIEKVTDPVDIMPFGIMSVPGLVIDGEVVVGGRVPSYDELKRILQAAPRSQRASRSRPDGPTTRLPSRT